MAGASFLQSCAFASQSRSLLSLSLPVLESKGAGSTSPESRGIVKQDGNSVKVDIILMPGLSGVPKQNTNGPWQRGTSGLDPGHTEKSRPAIIPGESCSACGTRLSL